jgi:hypothetical protein
MSPLLDLSVHIANVYAKVKKSVPYTLGAFYQLADMYSYGTFNFAVAYGIQANTGEAQGCRHEAGRRESTSITD